MHFFMRKSRNYRKILILRYWPKDFCQSPVSSLKLYVHARPGSIDSCQNGRSADHCHKTNVSLGMYTTRHFANTSLPSCQIRRQSVYSNIRHPYEGQLTAVKLGIRWPSSPDSIAGTFLPIEFTYILKFSADILFDHELNSEFLEWETHIKRVYSHIWFVWMV